MKIAKFKRSLIRLGIDVVGIYDYFSDILYSGAAFEFSPDNPQHIIFLNYQLRTADLIRGIHEDQTYVLLTDACYDIFSDLEYFGTLSSTYTKTDVRNEIKGTISMKLLNNSVDKIIDNFDL